MALERQALARSINQLVVGMQTSSNSKNNRNNITTNLVNAMNQNVQHQTAVTKCCSPGSDGCAGCSTSAAKPQFSLVETRDIGKPKPGVEV